MSLPQLLLPRPLRLFVPRPLIPQPLLLQPCVLWLSCSRRSCCGRNRPCHVMHTLLLRFLLSRPFFRGRSCCNAACAVVAPAAAARVAVLMLSFCRRHCHARLAVAVLSASLMLLPLPTSLSLPCPSCCCRPSRTVHAASAANTVALAIPDSAMWKVTNSYQLWAILRSSETAI